MGKSGIFKPMAAFNKRQKRRDLQKDSKQRQFRDDSPERKNYWWPGYSSSLFHD